MLRYLCYKFTKSSNATDGVVTLATIEHDVTIKNLADIDLSSWLGFCRFGAYKNLGKTTGLKDLLLIGYIM